MARSRSTPRTAIAPEPEAEPAPERVEAEAAEQTSYEVAAKWLKDAEAAGVDDRKPPEEAEEPETEQPAEQAAEETPAEEVAKPAEPEPDVKEYEKALAALRLDGVPQEQMERWDRKDLIRYGLKRAKSQGDVKSKFDGFSAEIGQLKGELARRGDRPGEPENGDAGTPLGGRSVESPGEPPKVNLTDVAKRFSEAVGVDSKDAEPVLTDFGKALTDPLYAHIQQLESQLRSQSNLSMVTAAENARAGLGEAFPQLKDDDNFEKLIEEGLPRLNVDHYANIPNPVKAMRAMVHDAAMLLFGAEAKASESDQEVHQETPPTQVVKPPSGRKPPKRQLSEWERSRNWLATREREAGMVSDE